MLGWRTLKKPFAQPLVFIGALACLVLLEATLGLWCHVAIARYEHVVEAVVDQCTICGKAVRGRKISVEAYNALRTSEELWPIAGQLCRACGALSCVLCRDGAFTGSFREGFLITHGYDDAVCAKCGTAYPRIVARQLHRRECTARDHLSVTALPPLPTGTTPTAAQHALHQSAADGIMGGRG